LKIWKAPIILPLRTPLRKVPEKFVSEEKVEGWGGLLKKIQAPFSGCSCWLASAKPCAAHTGEPTKPVGAVLAGPKEKGVRLIT